MNSLEDLNINQVAILDSIDDGLEIKKRLLDMGFTKGSMIECVQKSLFRGPIAYRIKNTVIAIRRCDAKKIYIGGLS